MYVILNLTVIFLVWYIKMYAYENNSNINYNDLSNN